MAKKDSGRPVKEFPTLLKKAAGGATQVWNIKVRGLVTGEAQIVTTYGQQDGEKQTASETISVGKNIGKKNATTPFEQAVLEAEARWKIKLSRKGYGRTVEQSAATRALSPMLALKYDEHSKKINWETAYTQPKLDGFRGVARRNDDGTWYITSRENKPMLALTEICGIFKGMDLPEGAIALDGELWHPELPLNKVSKGCKAVNEYTPMIQYHVYDLVAPEMKFAERYSILRGIIETVSEEIIQLVDTVKVRSESDLRIAEARYLEEGYEGAMLRHGSKGYETGKRSDTLLKVKTFQDGEFEIVDFKMGRGKYADVPIFVCVTEDGNNFDVTAHGTMEEKRALGVKAKQCIGKSLTVKYAYFTKTEEPVPFQPVAKGFA